MPADLEHFFPDLGDESLETAICVFHQRFSTNTLPKWPLAQPFRMLAHNGEINTIEGNRNWSKARTPKLSSPYCPICTASRRWLTNQALTRRVSITCLSCW